MSNTKTNSNETKMAARQSEQTPFIMFYSPSLFSFGGSVSLVFFQTDHGNGYTTITDMNNNWATVHSSYVTNLTKYPDQQEKAKELYKYINL